MTLDNRLPEILDVLRGLEASHVDRLAVDQLFGVGERRARQLMAGLPGIRVGRAELTIETYSHTVVLPRAAARNCGVAGKGARTLDDDSSINDHSDRWI